jgi:midasin (ATPase involved in ribosome maturation)
MQQVEVRRGSEVQTNGVPVIEFYPEAKKVRVLDVTLDVLPLPDDPLTSRYIPKWQTMKNRVCWDEPTITLIRDLAVRLQSGIPTRLEGPTGVSKSFAVQVICAITNRGFIRHNYSKDTDIGDIIGRFVPSDGSISMRLEDLLVHKDMTDEGREIIEDALRQSRMLTLFESKRIAQIIGFNHLNDDANWRWHNGPLPGSAMYGSTYLADERNLAPGNVNERENSIQERNPLLRIDEHEGEVIRPLTAEEHAIVDNGGIIPGVIGILPPKIHLESEGAAMKNLKQVETAYRIELLIH